MFHALVLATIASGSHDFDSQFGTWNVHVRRLVSDAGAPEKWTTYDGTHVVKPLWSGRANYGVLEIRGASGHIEGVSVRLYDPQAHQWSFTFSESRSGTLASPMVGGFKNGRGEFYDQETVGGRVEYGRSLAIPTGPTSYRDEYAVSSDGGKTWLTDWIATYSLASRTPIDAPSAPGPRSHDFDFEFGTWKAHIRRLLHPLTNSTTWATYDGTSLLYKIWDGRANIGELEVTGPAGHIESSSFRLYDTQEHQWNIRFASSAGGSFGDQAMTGGFSNGRGVFYDQEPFDGRVIFVRFIFSDISSHAFHFEQAFSDDGGGTWETNWISDFMR